MEQVLLYVAFGFIAVVAILVGRWYAEQRRKELAALAAHLGLSFSPEHESDFDSWHPHGVFQQGSSRRAYNLMRGDLDVEGTPFPAILGDYRYTVRSGKHSNTYRFSFLLMRPPWTPLPDLVIRPEHWGDKLMGAIGFDDIDFESEEFSRKFLVKSDDKRFAYGVVHPRMMEYLMQVEGPKVDLKDGECLFMTSVSTWDGEEFRTHVAWARRFFGLWPAHLLQQLEGERPGGPA